MLRKIGKKLINNLGLKLLAAFSAIILWVVVVNIDDPLKTVRYTTSVNFENTDYIENQLGQYFEVSGGSNTISFYVSAQRSIHEKLANSDFVASADMEKIEKDEEKENTWKVPVIVTQTKYNSDKVTIASKQLYMEVVLEELGTSQKVIAAEAKGTVADGCALGEVSIVGSNLLKISGPSSVVNQIDRAAATINVDGMSKDVTDNVIPVLYDTEGNVIDTTKLELSISSVSITAKILSTKDVSLEFLTRGTVEEGFVVTGIEYKPETVRVKGEPAVLNPINKITIPEEVLELTGAVDDIVTTVDITPYLPEDTALVSDTDARIEVTVRVEPIITKTFNVPVTNLTVANLRSGYSAEFTERIFTVELSGPESMLEELTADQIRGTVSASGRGRGDYQLRVTFELDEKYYSVVEQVTVPVTISGEDRRPEADGNGDTVTNPDENGTGEGGTAGEPGSSEGTSGTDSNEGAGGDTAPGEPNAGGSTQTE